uniref:Transposase n=1 Tax=Schistosoma curassoni TaxID=6186 RepID=A0A183K3Z0_9TREM
MDINNVHNHIRKLDADFITFKLFNTSGRLHKRKIRTKRNPIHVLLMKNPIIVGGTVK